MKRTAALALALLILASAFAFFPRRAEAITVDACYNNLGRCRQLALMADVGVIKTTLMLTACDLAFGVCLYKANTI
jgi:hypothetical protein